MGVYPLYFSTIGAVRRTSVVGLESEWRTVTPLKQTRAIHRLHRYFDTLLFSCQRQRGTNPTMVVRPVLFDH